MFGRFTSNPKTPSPSTFTGASSVWWLTDEAKGFRVLQFHFVRRRLPRCSGCQFAKREPLARNRHATTALLDRANSLVLLPLVGRGSRLANCNRCIAAGAADEVKL